MRKFLYALWSLFKYCIFIVLCVEILSFLAITVSNYIVYGRAREGSRAVYDAHTLFLQNTGIRPTMYNRNSPDKTKNKIIWMFGGSTMRGATDHDDKTIPSFLAKLLNSQQDGLNYIVVNFGMNSFNSLLESKYLQKELIENPEQPDLVIFYDGANDSKYFAEHRTPYGHHGYRRVKALIESYHASWFGLLKPLTAALYASFTKELYDKIHQVFIPIDPSDPVLAELVDLTEKRYDFLYKLVKCFGAEFILVWQPMIWVEQCQTNERIKSMEKGVIIDSDRFATVRTNFTVPYSKMAERLQTKTYFVNFRDALCSRTVKAYQPDGVHLTDDGRQLIAQQLFNLIRQRIGKKTES